MIGAFHAHIGLFVYHEVRVIRLSTTQGLRTQWTPWLCCRQGLANELHTDLASVGSPWKVHLHFRCLRAPWVAIAPQTIAVNTQDRGIQLNERFDPMVQSPEVCASVPSSNSFCLKFNTCPYLGETVRLWGFMIWCGNGPAFWR